MSVEKTYTQGARVWIPHEEKGWETAVIVENFEDEQPQLAVQAEDSKETKSLHIESKSLLPPLCHPQDSQLDKKDNLTSLAVIHEATVFNALRKRFEQRCIYNYCGIVAIAFNPYVKQPMNNSDEILKYHEQSAGQLEPHIFSVAEKAYRDLQRESRDQSIIFSGEAGSGKTENAKLIISYLTTTHSKDTQIKEKILAALTVIQAFGHAKTSKNDNSSRFGNFFELQYNNDYHIIGANIKTYLLNKSRVVFQPTQEQNFHIFYQLKSVQDRFPILQLNEREFVYLNAGNPLETEEANNSELLDETISALQILGFSSKQHDEIWRILAAILHLGNISFKRLGSPETSENVESCLISNLHGLKTLVKLFSLDQKASLPLRKWLCHKRILAQQDEILQPMTVDLATRNRDCLARFLYKKLFNWIVAQINASIRSPCYVQSFTGVLDMYGFENFSSNSFEQFCINYASEKIQQYCVQYIFKAEQEEYFRESIGWNFNKFHDNSLCVDLIEGRGGIIEIVDEETKKNSQATKDIQFSWIHQLHAKCEKSKHFSVWKDGSADFIIHHFVTSVRYDPKNFIEKNRETAVRELVEVLKDSKNELLRKMMSDEYSRFATAKERRKTALNRKQNKKSVLCEFRSSLSTLTETLNGTSPNFVICIKPNEEKKAWEFDSMRVIEQLHAFNVTEIIRVSAAGFFKQQSYANFFHRYHCLLPYEETERANDGLQLNCLKIVKINADAKDFSHIKFGKTKIFLREDDIFQLEDLRRKKQDKASIVIQKAFKRHLEMKRYWQVRRATVWVQNHARKCMKRRREQVVLRMRAATTIQAHFRGYLTRRWYRKFIRSYPTFKMYACLRVVMIVKKNLQMQMLNVFATLIQSTYRGYVVRRRYVKMRRSAIVIQACFRGYSGRRIAKKCREDQRKHKNLEIKLDDLQIETHLTPEELEAMHKIVDDIAYSQAKNKALNRVLFEKIETLKGLRGKPQNTHQEITKQTLDEAAQKTPRKNEEKPCSIPVIKINKDDVSEEVMQSSLASVHQVPAAPEEIPPIILEKKKEEASDFTEITVNGTENGKVEDVEELVQFDAIKAQEASALAYQETPPKKSKRERQKKCPLPEINLNLDEKPEEIVAYSTISANEIFKIIMHEDYEFTYSYEKMLDAYDKFDKRSEEMRNDLKLGDYELMNEQILNRDIETILHKINQSTPVKVKSFTDIALDISYQKHQQREDDLSNNLLAEKKKYLGMIQFPIKHTSMFVYHLVIDLEVPTILKSDPVMPATILFMCIRYLDSVSNNDAVILVMHVYKRAVEGLIKNFKALDATLIWLANTHQLLNYLKQYSKVRSFGWELYHLQNTEKQSEHHLRNLDITLLYNPLHSISVWLFKKALKLAEARIAKLVLPAILENEGTLGDVTYDQTSPEQTQRMYFLNHMYRLLKELSAIYSMCVTCGVTRKVTIQFFEQMFDFINSMALNSVLCQKEFCNNLKAAHIRCNIRTVEQWATNRKLAKAIASLAPIIEAMRLLHLLPFASSAVDKIIGCFKKLTYNQILKIISSYNPPFELLTFDQESMVQKLQLKIMEEKVLNDTLTLNNVDKIDLVLPFEYSSIHFDEIRIPKEFEFDDTIELI